jgi:hypothetical protein
MAEAAGSSPVVPGIHCKVVKRISLKTIMGAKKDTVRFFVPSDVIHPGLVAFLQDGIRGDGLALMLGRFLDSTVPLPSRRDPSRTLDARFVRMRYSITMDHLEVLREKVQRLRDEIAHLRELNDQYRRAGSWARNEADAQIAHGQRHERLEAIQQELTQLADLGRRVLSVEERKEEHRSRLHLVGKAS